MPTDLPQLATSPVLENELRFHVSGRLPEGFIQDLRKQRAFIAKEIPSSVLMPQAIGFIFADDSTSSDDIATNKRNPPLAISVRDGRLLPYISCVERGRDLIFVWPKGEPHLISFIANGVPPRGESIDRQKVAATSLGIYSCPTEEMPAACRVRCDYDPRLDGWLVCVPDRTWATVDADGSFELVLFRRPGVCRLRAEPMHSVAEIDLRSERVLEVELNRWKSLIP